MSQPSVWTRMKRVFAGNPQRLSSLPHQAKNSTPPGTEQEKSPLTQTAPLNFRSGSSSAAEQLQNASQRLVDLVDSIQRHQTAQDQRASEIADSLMRMAETLSDIREKNTDQIDTLARVADQLTASNERAARWEERIADLPDIVASQRDAVLTVARQMEGAGERDEQFLKSLSSFEDAVGSLGDATTASSVAIKNLQLSTLESDERIATLLKEQNKRFMMLFGVTILLVLAAVSAPYLLNMMK